MRNTGLGAFSNLGKDVMPNANAKDFFIAGDEIGRLFPDLLGKVQVGDSGEARMKTCLCLTVAELYDAVMAVLKSCAQSHALVLIRSMYETLADLKNLAKDPRYLDQMRFNDAWQAMKIIEEFENNAELQEDQVAMATVASLHEHEQPVFADLKAKGIRGSAWSISSRMLVWQASMETIGFCARLRTVTCRI